MLGVLLCQGCPEGPTGGWVGGGGLGMRIFLQLTSSEEEASKM